MTLSITSVSSRAAILNISMVIGHLGLQNFKCNWDSPGRWPFTACKDMMLYVIVSSRLRYPQCSEWTIKIWNKERHSSPWPMLPWIETWRSTFNDCWRTNFSLSSRERSFVGFVLKLMVMQLHEMGIVWMIILSLLHGRQTWLKDQGSIEVVAGSQYFFEI